MYPIDSDVLQAFMDGKPQKVTIFIEKGDERIKVQDNSIAFYMTAMVDGELTYVGSEAYPTITQNDIIVSGLTINRYASTTDGIGIGMVIPAELNVTFNNVDGRYDSSLFEDGEIRVELSVEGFEDRPVPYGTFIIDEISYDGTNINLVAYDRLVLMDRVADFTNVSLPASVSVLMQYIANACGITIKSYADAVNTSFVINDIPSGQYANEQYTYRQYFKWLCEIMGCNAYMDYDDTMVIKKYSSTSALTLTTSERFNSKKAQNTVKIVRVEGVNPITNMNYYGFLYNQTGIAINIEGNPLLIHDEQTTIANIFDSLKSYTYLPFEAQTVPLPHLYPMDCIKFKDRNNVSVKTCITDITYTFNQSTMIAAKGDMAAYKRRNTNKYNKTEQRNNLRVDNVYVPGTDDVDGQKLADNSVTHEKINVVDLFAQNLTATNFHITGGSVNIETNSGTIDVISLTYNDTTDGLFSTSMSSTAFSASGFGGTKTGYYGSEYCELSDANYEGSLYPEKVLFYDKTASNEAACFQAALPNIYGDGTTLQASFDDSPNSGTIWETGDFRPATDYDLDLGLSNKKWKTIYAYGADIGEIACKEFTNIYHDKRSLTVNAQSGTAFSLTVPTAQIGDDPYVQVTCANGNLNTGNISVFAANSNTQVIVSVVNPSTSQATGTIYTTLFYHSST